MTIQHQALSALDADLDRVRSAPAEAGTVRLIVRRPAIEERELIEVGELDLDDGLVGDMWARRPSSSTEDGGPNPDAQVTLMSSRAAALIAGDDPTDWAEAGDQLYVDLDLSRENLPARTRLRVGDAVLEVSESPHLGCGKFARRFGVDALKLVNSDTGRALRLRGVNTRVLEPGTVRRGDPVVKLRPG